MTQIEAAYKYRECGFSVIPVGPDKKATVKWEEFQKRFPTDDEIESWFKGTNKRNMAVITGPVSGMMVVDADEYKSLGLIAEVEKRIPREMVIPIQETPRGGRHYLFAYEQGFVNRPDYTNGLDIRTQGGYFVVWPSLNTEGKPWRWLRDQAPWQIPLVKMPQNLRVWIQSLQPAYSGGQKKEKEQTQDWFREGRRDNDLFHLANCLTKGKAEEELTRSVLTLVVASWGENDPKWVESKVESALKRDDSREMTITADVRDWVLTTTGNFVTTDCHKELNLTTSNHKKAAMMALLRLEKEGIIRKYGLKRGCYETIDRTYEEMDWQNADPNDYLKIEWPLGLEHKTRIFPRSVIVIAGVTGTGKTTYLLDLIRSNMNKFNVLYHNSEMSPQAMNYKLSQFAFPISGWNFRLLKWTGNTDQIDPDGLNIVDYLQAPEKVWEIQQPISRMLNRLNRGVVVIALQKKPGSTFGTGGIWGAMDASLVLGLEFGVAKVEKNRFREADNFNGMDQRDWTIKQGNCVHLSGWYAVEKPSTEKGFKRDKPPLKVIRPEDDFIHEDGERWER
jgi:hypothetical protein